MSGLSTPDGNWGASMQGGDEAAPAPAIANPGPTFAPAPTASPAAPPPPLAPMPADYTYAAPLPVGAPPLAAQQQAPSYGAPMHGSPGHAPQAQSRLTFRSWQPGIVALRPLPFHEFLTVPFKAMQFNRAVMIGGPLLAFTLAGLVASAAVWLAFTDDRLKLTSYDNAFAGIQPETVVVIVAAIVLAAAADLVASGLIYIAVARALLGERVSLREAAKQAWSRSGALLVQSLSVGLAVVALSAVIIVPIALLGAGASTGNDAASGAAFGASLAFQTFGQFGGYAFALLVGPLIAFARGILILERKGPFASIGRAVTLIKGRYWWSVLVYLVTQVVASFLLGAFFVVALILVVIASAVLTSQVIVAVVLYVVGALIYVTAVVIVQYPYTGAVGALVYLDQRMRKEGLAMDIARAAEANFHSRSHVVG